MRRCLPLGLLGLAMLAGCEGGTVSGADHGEARDLAVHDLVAHDLLRRDSSAADLATDGGVDQSIDPCNPLPQGCLCAQACSGGICDNTKCPCQPIAGASYGKLPVSSPCGCDPAKHGDMNLLLRSWRSTAATKGLVTVTGPTDGKAPQLYTLFADERVPAFPDVYQVQQWDWGCNCPKGYITSPEVTLAAMATQPGEVIHTPTSGYDIGAGHTAVVIHAGGGTITLKYTAEDNVVYGYTIHINGICVEPQLKALYDQCHAAGRKELPALDNKQALGRALAGAIQVAIRDTGSWMDPRAKKDWWQGK